MVSVKDKIMLANRIPNKTEIPIMNHRDDGEIREIRMSENTGLCQVFDFKTLYELKLKYGFEDCDVAIAEDFFWTAMPLMADGELDLKDKEHGFVTSAVMASVWGTPCIIFDDKAIACYKQIPKDDFPGVYIKDWNPAFLREQVLEVQEWMLETLANKLRMSVIL